MCTPKTTARAKGTSYANVISSDAFFKEFKKAVGT